MRERYGVQKKLWERSLKKCRCGLTVVRCTAKDEKEMAWWHGDGRVKENGRLSRTGVQKKSRIPWVPPSSPEFWVRKKACPVLEMVANNVIKGNQVLIKVKRVQNEYKKKALKKLRTQSCWWEFDRGRAGEGDWGLRRSWISVWQKVPAEGWLEIVQHTLMAWRGPQQGREARVELTSPRVPLE